jgi:hypothetical protein
VDACGRRRSPATLSSFHQGRPPRNKGQRYPADPPTVEEIIAVMRSAVEDNEAVRLRGLIVVLWRAGLRIGEALALSEGDLDLSRGAILVRRGKGSKRRRCRWLAQGSAAPVVAVSSPRFTRGAHVPLALVAAPRGRDERLPVAPALHDGLGEPRVLEVGVVERDHL